MSLNDVLDKINDNRRVLNDIANKRVDDLRKALDDAKKGGTTEDVQPETVQNNEENSQQVQPE